MKKIFTTLMACGLGLFAMSAENTAFIGDTGYETLEAAIAAAQSGETIKVTADQVHPAARTTFSGITLTIVGEGDVTIKRESGFNNALMYLINNNANITFENLTFDGGNISSTNKAFETNSGTNVTIKDCKFINHVTTNNGGVLQMKGTTRLENVSVSNNTVPAGRGDFFVGQNNAVTVAGTGNYSIYIEKGFAISADNFTGNADIISENLTVGNTVVKNANLANFTLTGAGEGYEFAQTGADLTIAYNVYVVENETTGTKYTSLNEAFTAAKSGDVIALLQDVDVTDRITSTKDVHVTIKGKTGTEKLVRKFTNKLFVSANSLLTFENLTFDCNNQANNNNELEVSNTGEIILNNVIIANSLSTQNLATVKAGRALHLNGVTAENCSTTTAYLQGNSRVELSGNNNLELVRATNESTITVTGELTNETPIKITLADGAAAGDVIVNGCTDPKYFALTGDNEDLYLAAEGENLVLASHSAVVNVVENETTGTGYATFAEAFAAAAPNDVLVLLEDVELADRIVSTKEVPVTIKGKTGNEKIIRTFENKLFFSANSALTFENLTLDCNNQANNTNELEVSNTGEITLNNVVIANSLTTQNLVTVKAPRTLHLNGVTATGCSTKNVYLQGDETSFARVELSGNNNLDLVCATTANKITVTGELTNETPINITLPEGTEVDEDIVMVNGCNDTNFFALTNKTIYLKADGDNLVISNNPNTGVGIKTAEVADDSVVNVYDFAGRVVRTGVEAATATEGLPRGMYIVGTAKVIVK